MLGIGATTVMPSTAYAGDPIAERSPREKALYAVVRTEVATVKKITEALGEAIRTYDADISQTAKDAHAEAKRLYLKAQGLHDKDMYGPAYNQARDAYEALGPAVAELLEKDHAPPSLIAAIDEIVTKTEGRMDAIAEHVHGKASDEGSEAYKVAKAEYLEAKGLWTEGKKRKGFAKLGSALKSLDKAVRITWPEADRAAAK